MALSNPSRFFVIPSVPSFPNQNRRDYTFSTGSAQSDKVLVVVATMPNNRNFSSATYDGVSMGTPILNQSFGGLAQRQVVYALANPSDGSNLLRLIFSGSQFNGVSLAIYNFTDCGGVGNFGISGGATTPNIKTLTISDNSMIVATGISVASQNGQDYTIATVDYGLLYQHNVNDQVCGNISTNIPSGLRTVTTRTGSGTVTNVRVEILEQASSTTNNGNFFLTL